MFEITGWTKFAEEYVFGEGSLPKTSVSFSDKTMRFKAKTVDSLIDKLMEFTGCRDRRDVELDACETDGRLDIRVMENSSGCRASQYEIEAWRKGECRLWFAEYSFNAERVNRETISLAA